MTLPVSLKNMPASSRIRIVFLLVLAAVITPECAADSKPEAFLNGFRETAFRNVRIQGEDFNASADHLKLRFERKICGGSGLAGVEASGLELRIKKPAEETAADAGSFFRQAPSSIPVFEIEGGAVFFESAPSFVSGGGVSFKSLKLSPGEDAFSLEVDGLNFGEFQIASIRTGIRAVENLLTFPYVSGVFAGGEFSAAAEADIEKWEIAAAGNFSDVHVEELPGFSGGDISGLAGCSFVLSGDPRRLRSLSAAGSARLREGNISRVPVLYGLAPAFLRTSYGDEVFSEGGADFTLNDGVFALENVRLISEDVSISAGGQVALDGRLDLIVESSLTDEHMRDRAALVEVFTHFLRICDYFIIRHRLTGTVMEPSYEPMPLPALTMLPLQVRKILGFLLPMKPRELP